jgi:hypothetical protein
MTTAGDNPSMLAGLPRSDYDNQIPFHFKVARVSKLCNFKPKVRRDLPLAAYCRHPMVQVQILLSMFRVKTTQQDGDFDFMVALAAQL